MGKIIEVNGEYFVEFFGNGLRFRKKAGGSLAEARAKLAQIEDSLAVTAPEVPPETATIELFFERYHAYAAQAHPARTAVRLQAAAQHCRNFLSGVLEEPGYLRAVTPRIMEDYKQHLMAECGARPVLINFTLYLLREVFEHAKTLGWLNDNPLQHVRNVPEPPRPQPRIYGEAELYRLREGLTESQDRVLAMLLYAGVTPAELRDIRWSDVDLEARELEVRGSSGGISTIRRVPLDVRLFDMLTDMRGAAEEQGPVFPDTHLPPQVNAYRLRNTFIRDVLARGVALTRLNRLLGVADVAKVFRYRVFLPAS